MCLQGTGKGVDIQLSLSSRNLLDNTILAATNTVLPSNTLYFMLNVFERFEKNVSWEGRGERGLFKCGGREAQWSTASGRVCRGKLWSPRGPESKPSVAVLSKSDIVVRDLAVWFFMTEKCRYQSPKLNR